MSFRAAKLRFANQVATARADAFGGSASDGTANAVGNNLSLAGVGFNAAFTYLRTQREIEESGFRVSCHAAALIRRSLNLSIDLGSKLTYLPTSEVFEVVFIVPRPGFPEYRVALKKLF